MPPFSIIFRSAAAFSSGTLLLLALLLSGCGEDPAPEAAGTPEPTPETLYFEPIGRGNNAAFSDTTRVLIRDADTWEDYRRSLRPLAPFKEVDFSQAMVLLVSVPASSGGYDIAVESVEQIDSTITANYVLTKPGNDCVTIMAQTQPFQAVLVRRAEGAVQFEQRVERMPCSID